MIKFKAINPMEEILDLVRANNPLLADVPTAAIIPSTITPLTGGSKNTRITLLGNGLAGVVGKISLDYDRADIGKIFNRFVEVNKTPTVWIKLLRIRINQRTSM